MSEVILSTKCSLRFANTGKKVALGSFIDEYSRVTQSFVDLLWTEREEDVPRLVPKDTTDKVRPSTWLSARAIQCSAKQASGIVRGTIQKHKQRMFVLAELQRGFPDDPSKFRSLQRKIDRTTLTKPTLKSVSPQLDSRFVDVQEGNNSFDTWLDIGSLGNDVRLMIPVRKTRHLNKLVSEGYSLISGVRLSKKHACLQYRREVEPVRDGTTVGIDIGIRTAISCSNGHASAKDNHGHDLASIQQKLARRKKGSRGFEQAQRHRENHINWTIRQLNFDGVKRVRMEDIKYLRLGEETSRFMQHWEYARIFGKVELECAKRGVHVERVSPVFTSQRCSSCGWTQSSNRNGKTFRCQRCGFAADADLNGSINIGADLRPISRGERREHDNKNGFYWHARGREPIVPCVKKE